MPTHSMIQCGESRSFPEPHRLHNGAVEDGEVLILIGREAGENYRAAPERRAVLVELDLEPLGVYSGESRGEEGSNLLGFARYRLGEAEATDLVELVRQPQTDELAIQAARDVLEAAGLEVAICYDFAGRIIDRLIRPYYNESLRRLDEGLATADDLDLTLKLGLGYPEGPIERLERTGLAHHFEVTKTLFEIYGERAYAPARRALVAKRRRERGQT